VSGRVRVVGLCVCGPYVCVVLLVVSGCEERHETKPKIGTHPDRAKRGSVAIAEQETKQPSQRKIVEGRSEVMCFGRVMMSRPAG
jgi:hypothetical protein